MQRILDPGILSPLHNKAIKIFLKIYSFSFIKVLLSATGEHKDFIIAFANHFSPLVSVFFLRQVEQAVAYNPAVRILISAISNNPCILSSPLPHHSHPASSTVRITSCPPLWDPPFLGHPCRLGFVFYLFISYP